MMGGGEGSCVSCGAFGNVGLAGTDSCQKTCTLTVNPQLSSAPDHHHSTAMLDSGYGLKLDLVQVGLLVHNRPE